MSDITTRLTLTLLGFTATSATLIIGLAVSRPVRPKSTATSTQPAERVSKALRVKATSQEIDQNLISYQNQLMTDHEVGRMLGEVKCGRHPIREAIDHLNTHGVPVELIENHTPAVAAGFTSTVLWC